jgi:hypothetical protein
MFHHLVARQGACGQPAAMPWHGLQALPGPARGRLLVTQQQEASPPPAPRRRA